MNNYLEEANKIVDILKKENKSAVVKQIENARLMGGTEGEIFDIICSLLKTYEISNPSLFNLIRKPAEEIYQYAENLGRTPSANFDLLEELSG